MADNTITTKWVYPPNWDGEIRDKGGWKKVHIIRTCRFGGSTNETDAIVLTIADLRTTEGNIVKRTAVERIKWQTYGLYHVILEWDRTPDEHIFTIAGAKAGSEDFRSSGGLVDPGEADVGTGDIIVTTSGAAQYDYYVIELVVRLKDH